jgi:hypothetical protein
MTHWRFLAAQLLSCLGHDLWERFLEIAGLIVELLGFFCAEKTQEVLIYRFCFSPQRVSTQAFALFLREY